MPTLLINVRFHDGRYHGAGDWPPSPARLFQALVAGAARGACLPENARLALEWLEAHTEAPLIGAPAARETTGFSNYVPNNDLDVVDCDMRRIGELRVKKAIRPRLFDPAIPLIYAWTLNDADEERARSFCALAENLYQLGRGVDMAWADGEILSEEDLTERLRFYAGKLYRPARRPGVVVLACPQKGSLASLIARHDAGARRFGTQVAPAPTKKTKGASLLFTQPPKARFRSVTYEVPNEVLLFDLMFDGGRAAWPLRKVSELATKSRDSAAARLKAALPARNAEIERVFIGRDATEADKLQRIRIIPLPSIGSTFADHGLRRIAVEIPPDCPLPTADIDWAFAGPLFDAATGEVVKSGGRDVALAKTNELKMLKHYGADDAEPARVWRSVTPVVLAAAPRRRIDPKEMRVQAKAGKERASEEKKACNAVAAALRHAGVRNRVMQIRVQREPFQSKGARAEAFAEGSRFAKYTLWHAEIEFAQEKSGPIVIGDGRYLGLGLMSPIPAAPRKAFSFVIPEDCQPRASDRELFLRAARRALMALDRDSASDKRVSRLFSGHEPDGSPSAKDNVHVHVFLAASRKEERLTMLHVWSPEGCDRRARLTIVDRKRFEAVVSQLSVIRAGRLGVIQLEPRNQEATYCSSGTSWVSETCFVPTRIPKKKDNVEEALADDLRRECFRRGLPRPEVTIDRILEGPRGGISGDVRLDFTRPVQGPIILGRGSHLGQGLFAPFDGVN
ncbi:MAG: type I-U CRISPR-associated protein Cas5/Cas6 [Parvularculaceae bacterium]|nr:type I-U CRISPR-associated protein Cas5/Cas6 [Parvularculaceae bacterium]